MKNKLVFVIISLFGGGAERVVSILSNFLSQRGWDVTILVYVRKHHEYPISSNVKIVTIPEYKCWNPIVKRFKQICSIRKILRDLKPDIVLPFLAIPTYQTFLASRGEKYLIYGTIRNNPKKYPSQWRLRKIVNLCTSRMDGIIYQTEEQTKFFPKIKNYFVMHNPVNSEMLDATYEYRERVKCIATFGRLTNQKNHVLLIRAFSKIATSYPNVLLKIYGEGEEFNNIQKLIKKLNLTERVLLMGNTKDIKNKLQETDIFVLSSDYEGLPNALIEAMAVGIPCISTQCPTGPKDLIKDGENGILVPCKDINAMASSIEQLIKSFKQRKFLGIAAKNTIKKGYAIEPILNLFENEIHKAYSLSHSK